METIAIILFVSFFISLLIIYLDKNKALKKVLKEDALLKRYRDKFNIPENAERINYIEGIPEIDNYEICMNAYNGTSTGKRSGRNFNVLFWVDDKYFNFAIAPVWGFDCGDGMRNRIIDKNFIDIVSDVTKPSPIKSIPKNNILCYSRAGDFFTKTSGGGSNLGGAVIGGALAGGAGAIIGSRGKIYTEVVDHRNTLLAIKTAGIIKYIYFGSAAIDAFRKFAPEKDISIVNLSSNTDNRLITASAENNHTPFDKLEKLTELKEKGIITEVEFNEKRKKLLDMI